ncbi:unnamed protein product [Mucor fragilis]
MADIVKFNSEDQPALEVTEAPQEERERQQENQQEIEHIQKKAHVQDTETQALQEEKEKAPGNVLDASGHVHAEPQQSASEAHQQEGGGVLPEQSNPHAHVWSNDPSEPFAGQWAPSMTKEPDAYDTKEEQPIANDADHSKKSRHHRLGSQSSELNRTFESTMTDLKTSLIPAMKGFLMRRTTTSYTTPLH